MNLMNKNWSEKMIKSLVLTLSLMLVFSISVAEVPQVINYQGYLTDNTGEPVEGAQLIKFKIYGSESGNDSLWSSGFQPVPVSDGLFSYDLGSSVVFSTTLFNNPNRYLGITVGVDPEISPRVKINSSAYAIRARFALSASSADFAEEAELAVNSGELDGHSGSYFLDWNNFSNIPAGFADGVDDVGGGGDITGVTAGSGLTGGASSGEATLAVGTGAITSSHLATNSVNSEEIVNESITTADIQNGNVYSADIANESIVDADISSSASIGTSKIYGTAVNLSSSQTITGYKTFDGRVYLGDSTMYFNGGSGLNFGSRYIVPS